VVGLAGVRHPLQGEVRQPVESIQEGKEAGRRLMGFFSELPSSFDGPPLLFQLCSAPLAAGATAAVLVSTTLVFNLIRIERRGMENLLVISNFEALGPAIKQSQGGDETQRVKGIAGEWKKGTILLNSHNYSKCWLEGERGKPMLHRTSMCSIDSQTIRQIVRREVTSMPASREAA
jgi:hypothetical protein